MDNYICYCTDHQHYNCTADVMGPVYPGQKVLKFDVLIKIDGRLVTVCKSQDGIIDFYLFSNTCHTVTYNIQSKMQKIVKFIYVVL